MTPPAAGTAHSVSPGQGTETFDHVACPFCGILCDDLKISRAGSQIKVDANGCSKASAGFERPLPATTAAIGGAPATLTEAINEAARLLRASSLPLFGGLATDVEGMRAVMALAGRAGGVVDHALSEGSFRNFKVLQSSGWVMTTLTEVRNRADLIIIVGTDIAELHPRFFERVVTNTESMFASPPPARTVVFIGEGLDPSVASGPRIAKTISLTCPRAAVGEVILALRARLKGAPITASSVAGVPLAAIDDLAARCRAATYGVIAWAPIGLDFPDADLTVQAICDTVRDLTVTQRFCGLALGGNKGATTAAAVSSWQAGYPLRVSFASGMPEYDPARFAINRMLAAGEGDLLVWINALAADLATPETGIPSIVLGTPGLPLPSTPAVFIPVGTPGVDHAGRLIRCDSVVSLPLRNLKRSALPSVATIVTAIESALKS